MTTLLDLPSDFQVLHANPRFSPGHYHVRHMAANIDVYLLACDATAAAEELPLHLHAPPAWEAYLNIPTNLRSPRPTDWTWGYLQARRSCLPRKGVYRPISQLQPAAVCAHPDRAVQDAREIGFLAYFFYIEAQRLGEQTQAA